MSAAPSEKYSKWYGDARWRRRRRLHLMNEPLCRMCLQAGVVTAATVADHIEPHKGDRQKFLHGALMSLCDPHHRSTKQQIEKKGFYCDIGIDGYPLDSAHPVYQGGGGNVEK